MDETFRIGGRLTLGVAGLTALERRALAEGLDPCQAMPAEGAVDIEIAANPSAGSRLKEIQRDAGDGRLTATDGGRFYVLEGGFACALPDLTRVPPGSFEVQPGFSIAAALRRLVRPTLQLALPARRAVAVHSAAVDLDGRAVLVAGWSESGKTETALALVEQGARFLSDKWTVVADDGTAGVFPIGVGVRGWVLRYLPRLDAALRSGARRRLRAAAAMRTLTRPLARGKAEGVRERVLTVADRVAVAPSTIRHLYGQDPGAPWHAPLLAVALLRTAPAGQPVRAREADPEEVVARLALTADFERRGIFELYDRAQWSAPARDPGLRTRLMLRERALLEQILAARAVIEVSCPFPTDPRPVAEAILQTL